MAKVELVDSKIPYVDNISLKYIEAMEKEGYEIFTPDEDELLLDIDTIEQIKILEKNLAILQNRFPGVIVSKCIESSSGYPHRHVHIKLPFDIADIITRLLLQAALGSDPTKELLSYFRVVDGDPIPTLLARKPNGKEVNH